MKALKESFKLLLTAADFIIAMFAVIFLFGEEAPDAHFAWWQFFGIKILAGVAIYALYKWFLWRGKHNLLPFFLIDDYKELISPESDADRA